MFSAFYVGRGGPTLLLRRTVKPGEKVGVCVRFQNKGGQIAFLIDPWRVLELTLE